MTPGGPRFLDEDAPAGRPLAGVGSPAAAPATGGDAGPDTARFQEPVLLDVEADAVDRVDVGWQPERVITAPVRVGTGFWLASGLCVLVASWAVLSLASFVLALLAQSLGLGIAAMVGVGLGCLLLLYALVGELQAYRSLGVVEELRAELASSATPVEVARRTALRWMGQLGSALPAAERATVERLLAAAATTAEVRGVLRSQVADRLREQAGSLGRRAAVEGATVVAVCPHPAWDGLFAGGRGLLVIRRVAALYGLRPGLAVTVALLRKVAWTAAGTTGVSLLSQGLADHVLASTPGLKHVVGALPGTGVVAVRLYRLAGVTAEACSPV